MRTGVSDGDVITAPAPANVAVGAAVKLGEFVGIATSAALQAADVVVALEGVFTVAKTTSEAWTVGQKLYLDESEAKFTTTDTGNVLAGLAFAAAGSSATTGQIFLIQGYA